MTDPESDITRARATGSDTDTRPLEANASEVMSTPARREGRSLGRYVVIDELGRGGMGLVLRAYDPKLQREVAIKVLRSRALGPTSEARMVHEARAMAKLSHPHVVSVYDVELGLSSGVMVVMEYVPGCTLRQWLAQPREWAEIVAAFVSAGRGLAAAHAKDLLHRDFKPANVLATADGRIKVTDFGLAKFGDVTAEWEIPGDYDSQSILRTRAGAVMGTPRYMAPEQHTGSDVDARTDQYAFCVAAWEALAGEPPFHGRDLATYARSKIAGPEPWPKGSSVPGYVVKALHRGLSLEPADRWPSMTELLEVLAHAGGRRRRRIVYGVTGGAIAAVLSWVWSATPDVPCSGAVAQLEGVWDAPTRDRLGEELLAADVPYAEPVWSRTSARLDDYADTWVEAHTEACRATSIRKEQSAEVMDLRMACLYRAKVGLSAVVEQLSQADKKTVANAHRVVSGLPSVRQCAEIELLRAEVPPPEPAVQEAVDKLRAEVARAQARYAAGHYSEVLELMPDLEEEAKKTGYSPLIVSALELAGRAAGGMGRFGDAEIKFGEGLRMALGTRQWSNARQIAYLQGETIGSRLGRFDEGLVYAEVAWGLLGASPSPRAEAQVRTGIGGIKRLQGRLDEAEEQHRAALDLMLSADADDPNVANARTNIAILLQARGEYEAAEAEQRAVLAYQVGQLGEEHPVAVNVRANLASALFLGGKHLEAVAEQRQVLASQLRAAGPDHPAIADARNNLGMMLSGLGDHAAAEAEHRTSLALRVKLLGPEHPTVASSHNNLGEALTAQGKYAEAEVEHREALAHRLRVLDPDHPHLALSRTNLAHTIELQKGDLEEAIELAEAAWARRSRGDVPAEERGASAFLLARLLRARQVQPERARELAEEALEAYAKAYVAAGAKSDDERAEIRAWLAA